MISVKDPPIETSREESAKASTVSCARAVSPAETASNPARQNVKRRRRAPPFPETDKAVMPFSLCGSRTRNPRQVLGQEAPVLALLFAFVPFAEELDDE